MNSFSIKLRRIFSNKNVVTILCFITIAVVLILGYNFRIKKATSPIRIPYAKVTIEGQTQITEDMIGTILVASNAIRPEMYTKVDQVKGKYVNLGSTIYAGSYFYKGAIVDKGELPTEALLDVPDGDVLLTLKVDMESSYYNSLVPGGYFDIYVRTIGVLPDEKTKDKGIMVGKLLNNIKILAVKTSDGKNVFGSDEDRVPAGILFSLPEEYALLLMKADYFSKLSDVAIIEFSMVPRNKPYKTEDGEEVKVTLTSDQLQEYINEKTKDIDVNEIKKNTELGG